MKKDTKKIITGGIISLILINNSMSLIHADSIKQEITNDINLELEAVNDDKEAENKEINLGNKEDLINHKNLNEEKINVNNNSEKDLKSADSAILLDPTFIASTHEKGSIKIPFKLFHYGGKYEKYYVEIYNSNYKKVAEKSDYFPSSMGITNLKLEWDANKVAGGKYYVRHWSTRDTSLRDVYYPFNVKINQSEYFNSVINGSQNAMSDNLFNPMSAWKLTSATYKRYSSYDPIPYEVRLEEMYVGDEAAAIVNDENMFNDKPTPNEQWILMKYYLKNNGSDMLEASDILNKSYFYTKNGASMKVSDIASFSGEREGQGIYDIDLYSGGSSYCWLGILVPKSDGFPYLQLSNGYDKGAKYSWLNTDPSYGYDWKNHWAKVEIEKAMNDGWIDKTDKFRPDDSMTRAEFVKTLNRAFGLTTTSGKVFEDTKTHWAKNEIDIAVTNGVCGGVSDTKFNPDGDITRQEVAKMVVAYKNVADSNHDKLNAYSDKSLIDNWALDYVEGAIEQGYMKGNDGKFNPKGKITRAEAVTTLGRIN